MIDKLKLVCDKNDPADRKLLLLAELFDERCQLLEEHQTEMSSRLESTDRKPVSYTHLTLPTIFRV